MYKAHETVPSIPAFLITDSEGLRRYGLGMVRPGGKGLAPFLADGYLTAAPSLAELAGKLGIDAAGLSETVARMNEYARTGIDPEFGRGTTAYHRVNGDASRGLPNPNLGPIGAAPFYAVKLLPGDIGAATGLVTDENAQVLGPDDRPIGGLYAVGNDMQSVMGGVYPGAGHHHRAWHRLRLCRRTPRCRPRASSGAAGRAPPRKGPTLAGNQSRSSSIARMAVA